MALIADQMQPAPASAPATSPRPQSPAQPSDNNVIGQAIDAIAQSSGLNPRDQEGMKRLAYAAIQIMYGEKTGQEVARMLQASGTASPGMALAQTATTLLSGIVKKTGQNIPPMILLTSGAAILLSLADMAGHMRLMKIDMDVIGQALRYGVQILQKAFDIPPQIVAQVIPLLNDSVVAHMSQQYSSSPQGQQALSMVRQQVAKQYAPLAKNPAATTANPMSA